MSEHEHAEPEPDERAEEVQDLDVPEEHQDDVAGGSTSGSSDIKPNEDYSLN